jgi:voltage-gated potassium channel
MLKKLTRHHRFMISQSRALFKALTRPILGYLTIVAFTVMGLASVVMWLLEFEANPKFESPFDSLYFVVTTMSGVGYGDLVPVTTLGRAFSMGLMLLGTALFATYVAVIASSIVELEIDPDSADL